MASRRIYITLNDQKENDRIIESYLSQSYSESDAIKEAIYRLAINNIQKLQDNINSTEKVKLASKEDKEAKKGTRRSKRVQKDDSNIKEIENVPISNDKVQVVPKKNQSSSFVIDDRDKAQIVTNNDITIDLSQFTDELIEVKSKNKTEELKVKKLKALQQFV